MTSLAVYGWAKPGIANFGDELGPDILRRLGHRVVRAEARAAEVAICGSILEKLVDAPKGCIVAGVGSMHMGKKLLPNPNHLDIRALRGELTRKAMNEGSWTAAGDGWRNNGHTTDVPLGDPGILASALYELAPRQAHRLGVVPHYIDGRTFPYADVTIDVTAPPHEVIYEISKCSRILSSSLHGLIVAESLGIPAMRLPYHKVIGGDDKWVDYYTGVNSQDTLMSSINGLLKVLEAL